MKRFVNWLASKLDPPRVIYDREGGSPYLSRYYVFGAPKASDGKPVFDKTGNPRPGIEWNDRVGPVGIYLHKFHRSDDDQDTHSHPWLWSIAIILSGGYSEERRVPLGSLSKKESIGWAVSCTNWVLRNKDRLQTVQTRHAVIRRKFRPISVNFIRGSDFHRVDLLSDESWSLFIAGPRVSGWSFWNRFTGEETPWREFIARKRGQKVDEVKVS